MSEWTDGLILGTAIGFWSTSLIAPKTTTAMIAFGTALTLLYLLVVLLEIHTILYSS